MRCVSLRLDRCHCIDPVASPSLASTAMVESHSTESEEGASTWQQLLYAAKTDSVELCETCLKDAGLEVNKADGLGMTALHYA